MSNAMYGVSLSGGGVSIQATVVRSADGVFGVDPTLPAGKAGTLSTRTDDNTGVAGLSGGHGIVSSDVVDVYWSGGVRYGMTATVSGNDVTVDGGAGDNLPAQGTAVVVTKQVQINASIDGDALEIIGFRAEFASTSETSKIHLDCQDSGGSSIEAITLTANQPRVDDIDGGVTNVFSGNPITKIMASNGSSTNSCILKVIWAQDVTPQ